MAQNVTIAGASYTDVTAIEVPKTTSGVASFHDVTDTTATASDVAVGKYFYTAAGVKTAGQAVPATIVETALPGGGTHLEVIGGLDLSNDTVAADKLLYGYTAHDKSGTAITGTLTNTTGTSVEWNDVNFYDYDGTRLYSYSAAEFALLTAMPPNPTHVGLTSQGWNWSLANAKTQVAGSGGCDIGQMYITSDGKTRLYIKIDRPIFKQLQLGLVIEGTITINWGDNSSPSTVSRSGIIYETFSHNYSNLGDYCISISVSNDGQLILTQSEVDCQFLFSYPNATQYLDFSYVTSLLGILKKVELGNNVYINENAFYRCVYLESISIPNSIYSFGSNSFWECQSLKYVTIPQYAYSANDVMTLYDYIFDSSGLRFISLPDYPIIISYCSFSFCRDLESIAFPYRNTQITDYIFQENTKLKAIYLHNTNDSYNNYIPSHFVNTAYALAKIVVPENIDYINDEAFTECEGLLEIHFRSSTPPILSGSGAFGYMLSTDCKIYVPTGSLSAYTSATNYPDPADYTYIEE